jgi:hypothetical protein
MCRAVGGDAAAVGDRAGGKRPKTPIKQGCGGVAFHNNGDQNKMRTVIMKLPPEADFSSEMARMREWLDKHRCAPSTFKYDLERESLIIQVEFNKEEEAEIFKGYIDVLVATGVRITTTVTP